MQQYTELESKLIEKKYWRLTKQDNNRTILVRTAKWTRMLEDIFAAYGDNVIITPIMINNYIKTF